MNPRDGAEQNLKVEPADLAATSGLPAAPSIKSAPAPPTQGPPPPPDPPAKSKGLKRKDGGVKKLLEDLKNAGKNKDELRRLLSRVDDDGDEYATSTSTAEDGPFFLGFCIHWILNARYPGIPWVGYADDSAGEPAAL